MAVALLLATWASPAAAQHGDDEKPLPEAECLWYDAGTSTWVALWGYDLEDDSPPVDVPIGSKNRFTPPPAGQGQPTHFEPRRHYGVFVTYFKLPVTRQVWQVGSRWDEAEVGDTRRCSGNPVPLWDPTNPVVVFGALVNAAVLVALGRRLTTGGLR